MRQTMIVGAAAVLLLAGCGSGSDSGSGTATTSGTSPGAVASGATTTGGTGTTSGGSTGGARGGAPVAKYASFNDPVYADQQNWLCGPGAASKDRCLTSDQSSTLVRPDGSTEIKQAPPAADPEFDCFYVYPTVNFGGGNDTGMATDTGNEDSVVDRQAARLRTQCRVYAPLYRQTMGAGDTAMAYGDVKNAFSQYMARWNGGRPMLLIGHSQGSGMLLRLMQDEFDADPDMRSRLVSALLIGGSTTVPEGQAVGGSFKNIPSCATPEQNGCVIAYNSVAATGPDEDRVRWGAGNLRLCTNPAALGGGSAKVSVIMQRSGTYVKGTPETDYTTPYIELPDAFTAECQTKMLPPKAGEAPAPFTNLAFSPAGNPGDVRDIERMIQPGPGFWALHIQEVQLVLRDLLDIIERQTAGLR